MIHFIGCTHFDHAKIIRLAGRPFFDLEEMNETMVSRWNAVVMSHDTVYHLGDFAFGNEKKWMSRLKGNIVRIKGNHDDHGLPYAEIEEHGRKFVLFHYPIEEWNGYFKGSIHVHCHQHSHDLVSAERRFNVSVEATAYRPISIEEILDHPNSAF